MGGQNTNIKRKHPIARPGHSSVLQRDGKPQAPGLRRSTCSNFAEFAALSKTTWF